MSRALILMYHLVDTPLSKKEQRFCTPINDFAQQIKYLSESGYTPLSMEQLCNCMQGNEKMPEKSVHITFDDGFTCVLEHAAPILQRHGFPATMFALSDRLGFTNDWMSSRGFPERTLLSKTGLYALEDAGFTIGSHTRTHACLPEVSTDDALDEIRSSKHRLEDALGKAINYFAYPFGKFNSAVRDQVADVGYKAACSTRSGFNRPGEDPYLLRRIDVFGTDRLWQFRQKLKFGTNETSPIYPLRYLAGRVMSKLGV